MPSTLFTLHEFADFDALSDTLAHRWLDVVQRADKPASFALAGGTTPAPLYRKFDRLFAASKPGRIQLIATDERWVADADAQSNEGLFRQCFADSAAQWRLVSLKNALSTPTKALADIDARIAESCPAPFSAVILGMGADGHIASLFPNAPQLLVNDPQVHCVAALHPQTLQERMSLSFSRLLNTEAIWLVITGTEKRNVLNNAGPTTPIGAYLNAARCATEVFWCP